MSKAANKKTDLAVLNWHRREMENRVLRGEEDPHAHAELCETIAKLSR